MDIVDLLLVALDLRGGLRLWIVRGVGVLLLGLWFRADFEGDLVLRSGAL